MIEKTEAIILKSKKFRESSKILTLFTKDYGKLNLIAKGSRTKKNKFGGSLETLSNVSIVFYYYPQKDFHYISQSSIINFFHNIHKDINKTIIALAIAEMINNTTHTNDKNEPLYKLILDVYNSLNDSKNDYLKQLVFFQIHYAIIMGYSPNFTSCAMCNQDISLMYKFDTSYLNLENGAVFCKDCKNKTIIPLKNYSPKNSFYIKQLTETQIENLSEISIPHNFLIEIFSIFHQYLKNHLTGMKDLKSLDLFFSFSR